VVLKGRDPLTVWSSGGRWSGSGRWSSSDGTFGVLYTSLKKDGAIAEVHSWYRLQPVFPSTSVFSHRLGVSHPWPFNVIDIADLADLIPLGVAVTQYQDRDYRRTQEIAAAVYSLGFDGMMVPSARWPSCTNVLVFADRIHGGSLTCDTSATQRVRWGAWCRQHGYPPP